VLVVVLDDLGLGGIDAKRISKAVNLLGRELDRTPRRKELLGGYRYISLSQFFQGPPERSLVFALLPLYCG
jgi:hypothetical protein